MLSDVTSKDYVTLKRDAEDISSCSRRVCRKPAVRQKTEERVQRMKQLVLDSLTDNGSNDEEPGFQMLADGREWPGCLLRRPTVF